MTALNAWNWELTNSKLTELKRIDQILADLKNDFSAANIDSENAFGVLDDIMSRWKLGNILGNTYGSDIFTLRDKVLSRFNAGTTADLRRWNFNRERMYTEIFASFIGMRNFNEFAKYLQLMQLEWIPLEDINFTDPHIMPTCTWSVMETEIRTNSRTARIVHALLKTNNSFRLIIWDIS